jgi:hypothetical protein
MDGEIAHCPARDWLVVRKSSGWQCEGFDVTGRQDEGFGCRQGEGDCLQAEGVGCGETAARLCVIRFVLCRSSSTGVNLFKHGSTVLVKAAGL